jgi:hypothetical protein
MIEFGENRRCPRRADMRNGSERTGRHYDAAKELGKAIPGSMLDAGPDERFPYRMPAQRPTQNLGARSLPSLCAFLLLANGEPGNGCFPEVGRAFAVVGSDRG